jgi:transposase-like protein
MVKKTRHTEEFKRQAIADFHASGIPASQFSQDRGISNSTFMGWLKKGNFDNSSDIQDTAHPQLCFDERPSNRVNVIDELADLARIAEKNNKGDKDYAKIAIKANRPIAVMKGADFHLGGLDVSYGALLDHYKFLLQEEGFYMQLFGDDINMMIVHKTVGARHDILSPNKQCELISSMVDELVDRQKLISMCWGNHSDEFAERTSGLSLLKLLVAHKIPYFRGVGYIDLVVGSQTYPMAFTHKMRFNSFMNQLHGNKRMEQMHTEFFGPGRPIAREYITAHTHYPAYSVEGNLPSDRVWYVKVGTFKCDCLFSQRYYGQGRIGVPTTVYFPDRFEHIVFPTPYEAYRYMNGKDWSGLKNSAKK